MMASSQPSAARSRSRRGRTARPIPRSPSHDRRVTDRSGPYPERGARWNYGDWIALVVVILASALTFSPALRNGFVDWDDSIALLENPHFRGLGPTELRWMWTTFYLAIYRSLTWMTYGADYLVWGLNPFGYHLTNVILHVVNAALVYTLCRRLLILSLP